MIVTDLFIYFFERRMFSRWIVTNITSSHETLHCRKTRIPRGDQLVFCGQFYTRLWKLIDRIRNEPQLSDRVIYTLEDGGSMFFRNVIFLQVHTALQPWRSTWPTTSLVLNPWVRIQLKAWMCPLLYSSSSSSSFTCHYPIIKDI
jgi:hypothetical protein